MCRYSLLCFFTFYLIPETSNAQFDKIKKTVDKNKKENKEKKDKKTTNTGTEDTGKAGNDASTTSGSGTGTSSAGSGSQQKNKQAQREEHETYLKKLRSDAWEYYDTPVTMEYGTENSEKILNLARAFDYYPRAIIADSICYKVYTTKDLETGTIWTNFVWVVKTFWELYPNKLAKEFEPAIQGCMKRAADYKANGNLAEAKNWAGAGLNYINALKIIQSPNHQDGAKLAATYEKDAQSLYTDLKMKIGAKFYTSRLHADQALNIVFSKKPIVIKTEDAASFTNAFTLGDNIYAMGYFESDLNALSTSEKKYNVAFYIDTDPNYAGEPDFYTTYPISAVTGKNSYAYAEIIPAFAANNQTESLDIMRNLKRLKMGKHNIMMKFLNFKADVLAKGYFTLDCTSDGMTKFEQWIAPFEDRELEKVRMPKAEQNNPALESDMKRVLKEVYPDWTVLRLVIAEKNWTIEKNSITGEIEYRHIGTSVAIKDQSGECRVYWVSFKQNYADGKYGELWKHGVGDNKKIKCENVMK